MTLAPELARDALRRAAAALDAAETARQPLAMSRALADTARATLALGALASAETYYQQALRWARAAGSTDQVVDLLCAGSDTASKLAAVLDAEDAGSGRSARDRARDQAFEATTLAPRVADADCEPRVLLRIAEVLERCGDHDDALRLQTRALRLVSGGPRPGALDPGLLSGRPSDR